MCLRRFRVSKVQLWISRTHLLGHFPIHEKSLNGGLEEFFANWANRGRYFTEGLLVDEKRFSRGRVKLGAIAPQQQAREPPTTHNSSEFPLNTRSPSNTRSPQTRDPQTSLLIGFFIPTHHPSLSTKGPHCQPGYTGSNDPERQGQRSSH